MTPDNEQFTENPANTKHFYNICTMLDQRQRRWADVVQMLLKKLCLLRICLQFLNTDHILGPKFHK